MCLDPATATQLAITVGSALITHSMQETAANTQEAMVRQGYDLERTQTQRQYADINQQSQQDKSERYRQHVIDQGHIRAVAAESGLAGVSQERIDAEESNNAATDIATIEANRVRQVEQAHSQGVSKMSQANIQLAGIKRPSVIGTGLQIAGSAAGAWGSSKQKTGGGR